MFHTLLRQYLVIVASCVLLLMISLPLTMLPRNATATGQPPQPTIIKQGVQIQPARQSTFPISRSASQQGSGCVLNPGIGYYCYATALQDNLHQTYRGSVQGALADYSQYAPHVASSDTQSLAEIALFNDTQKNYRRVLEVGWAVSPVTYGNGKPHLFVYTRDQDNQISNQCRVKKVGGLIWSCAFKPYNGAKYEPEQEVPSDGSLATIYVVHFQNALWIEYGSNWIGSIPDSWWWGSFTEVGSVQWYGEVLAGKQQSCTYMGNALFGSQLGAAKIDRMVISMGNSGPYYYASATPPSLTDSNLYNAGSFVYNSDNQTIHSFTYGGPGACVHYFWVTGEQDYSTQGASGSFSQHQPYVDSDPVGHSSAEVGAFDGTFSTWTQSIEIGWMVAQPSFHDTKPHLFVATWYHNGKELCYVSRTNSCDFHAVSGAHYYPGDPVTVTNTPQIYQILHFQGNWWIGYVNQWIGYIPDSHWNNTFTQVKSVQWLGEVSSANTSPCTDMGDSTKGSVNGSAVISNMFFIDGNGGPYPVAKAHLISHPYTNLYDAGHFSPNATSFNSFTYGGGGAC